MASRRAIREELHHFLAADKDGNPANLPDPPPPYEDGSNRLFELLSRASQMPITANKLSDDSRTVYELLPLLLLRIFGYRPGSGWLETCSDLPHRDREGILRLIMPDGPIHNFCRTHDPSNFQSNAFLTEYKYEFWQSNLPDVTYKALNSPSYGNSSSLKSQSALAHLLRETLPEPNCATLSVTPMQYLELCLVSSAARKWTDAPRLSSKSRRQKRSSSLPSVRALFNRVIAAYAGLQSVNTRLESTSSLLIPACIDMYCLPWVESVYAAGCPRPSTPSVDALSSVLYVVTPKSDGEALAMTNPNPAVSWTELTHGQALYLGVEIVLSAVFRHYNTKDLASTFIAYVRLFALYLAPWSKTIRLTMETGLFPKKRSNGSSGRRSFSSTLNSINEQIKYASGVSPRNSELVSMGVLRKWREKISGDNKRGECGLLIECAIRAANQRVASVSDGCRALVLVAEAASAAQLVYDGTDETGGNVNAGHRLEEVKGCLIALREQVKEAEARLGMKTKPFVSTIAKCLKIELENNNSLFSVSRVAETLSAVATNSGAKSAGETSRLVERRRSTMLRQSLPERVEFMGSVWEQPITTSENAYLIYGAYWLSLKLEPYVGFAPNIRILGRPSTWLLIAVTCCFLTSFSMLVRKLLW